MSKGKKAYIIIAILVIVLIIGPLFGFVFTVLHSIACALCHGSVG